MFVPIRDEEYDDDAGDIEKLEISAVFVSAITVVHKPDNINKMKRAFNRYFPFSILDLQNFETQCILPIFYQPYQGVSSTIRLRDSALLILSIHLQIIRLVDAAVRSTARLPAIRLITGP
jgi:hypothetical protein